MTPKQAYYKAIESEKRMPKLELIISKNAYWSFLYALYVIKGRWELGEPVISKNAEYSYFYAQDVIRGRLPDFMHNQMIIDNNEYTKQYVEFIQ